MSDLLTPEGIFKTLEEMDLIKNHYGHKKDEVTLVSCARCTYEEIKEKVCRYYASLTNEEIKSEVARLIQENSAQPYTGANKISALFAAKYDGYLSPDEVEQKVTNFLEKYNVNMFAGGSIDCRKANRWKLIEDLGLALKDWEIERGRKWS